MPRASSKSEPEPAEGQVPAGKFEPAPQVQVDQLPKSEKEGKEEKENKSNNEVAKEVIAGRWGRGQACKKRLQAAGYDVAAVSEEVTKIFNQ
jgi:CW_7 repeat